MAALAAVSFNKQLLIKTGSKKQGREGYLQVVTFR